MEQSSAGSKETTEQFEEKDQQKHDLTSAKVLLTAAQKEYEYETDRKKTLETRAGVFVAFSGLLVTLITRVMDFEYFKDVQPDEFISYAVIFGLFLMIPFLCLLVSLFCFVHVIIVKKYSRLNISIFDEEMAKLPEEEMTFYLMEKYQEIVFNNRPLNNRKSKYFLVGSITTGVAAFLLATMYLIVFVY